MSDPCCGYFVNGVPPTSGCGCACPKMCPPPYCTSVKFTFEVGTPYSAQVPEGCKCDAVTFHIGETNWETKEENSNLIPFPTFNLNFGNKTKKEIDEEYVFSLADNCSIPCTKVDVTITTTGCGLELIGKSVRTVGNGTVSGTYSGGGGDCEFTLDINGGGSSVYVADGGGVSVSLTATNPCCSVCLINVTCPSLPAAMRNLIYRASHISKGTKTYLNKHKLIQKIKRLKRR